MNNKKISTKILGIIFLVSIVWGTLFLSPKPAYAIYKPFGGWILASIYIPPTAPPVYLVVISPPSGGVFKFITGTSIPLSGRYPPVPGFPTLGLSFGGIILYLW